MTATQIAEIFARVGRTTVQFPAITLPQLESTFAGFGLPPTVVNAISRFQQALQDGAFDVVTGDVERLSGRRPDPLEDFLSRSLSAGQSAHA